MFHQYEPCTHPGRHGYTLPGEAEYEFCDRCRQPERARCHQQPERTSVEAECAECGAQVEVPGDEDPEDTLCVACAEAEQGF